MSKLILSCVFGSKHTPFVHTFICSVLENSPGVQIVIGYNDFPDFELRLLEVAYPEVIFTLVDLNVSTFSTHAANASKKTQIWRDLLEQHVSNGDNAIFMDIDTLMLESPFEVFNSDEDIFVTRKSGKWPLNTGVVFVKKTDSVIDFFNNWHERTETMITSPRLNQEAEKMSGGADQHSLMELLGIQETIRDKDRQDAFCSVYSLRIKFLNCSQYNETESVPFTNDLKVIHYKAGWHKILISKSKYTKNRPAKTSTEFHNIWNGYYSKSKLRLYSKFYGRAWLEKEIVSMITDLQYEDRGIYNSELVLICSLLKMCEIKNVLESGRARGHSTYVLSEYFSKQVNSKIVSVDYERNSDTDYSEQRLSAYTNTILKYGHANVLFKEIIRTEIPENLNYAVLLDGPKSLNAIYLAARMIRSKHCPSIIFIHDMRRYEGGVKPSFHRFLCQTIFDRAFFSDDFGISTEVIAADQSVFTQRGGSPHKAYQPYVKNFLPTGSYGPTLAIIFPSQRDKEVFRRLLLWPLVNAIDSSRQLLRFWVQGQMFRIRSQLGRRQSL
jgi:hypothetical protein